MSALWCDLAGGRAGRAIGAFAPEHADTARLPGLLAWQAAARERGDVMEGLRGNGV